MKRGPTDANVSDLTLAAGPGLPIRADHCHEGNLSFHFRNEKINKLTSPFVSFHSSVSWVSRLAINFRVMEALVTRASPDPLWRWSDGLALTSVGLQGPHWDVKGPRWLLSPRLSIGLKHRWQGLATINDLPEGDQRTFSAILRSHESRPSFIFASWHKGITRRNRGANNGG